MKLATSNGVNPQVSVHPDFGAVIWGKFVAPFAAGDERFALSISVEKFGDFDRLVPSGARVTSFRADNRSLVLAEMTDWSALLVRFGGRAGSIQVLSSSAKVAERAMKSLSDQLPDPALDEDAVRMDFWQLGQQMFTSERSIDSPPWSGIASNYPTEVGLQVLDLMKLRLTKAKGRVVLWHGPPGTGKTTAIRSLAGAWKDQAKFQIVLDPELVFAASSHMMSVILGDDEESDEQWRVLVIEDADNLVARDGHNSHILSRLLNIGDGIVGQGLRVLLLMTTNKPPGQLHPALSRPGRCLADTEFRPFTHREAVSSFGLGVPNRPQLTLAELMNQRPDPVASASTGLYL